MQVPLLRGSPFKSQDEGADRSARARHAHSASVHFARNAAGGFGRDDSAAGNRSVAGVAAGPHSKTYSYLASSADQSSVTKHATHVGRVEGG